RGVLMLKTIAAASVAATLLMPMFAHSQHPDHEKATTSKKMSTAQKIKNAMSAAPAEISRNATIMDWPEKAGGQPTQLRAGNNGWVCFPNSPSEFGAASVDD